MPKNYILRELTPEDMKCAACACPAIYEITPEEMRCVAAACPSIYEITPKEMKCAAIACLGIYKDKGTYLIIGKKVDPKKFGLEKKVGEGEVLIKVPQELIDEKGKS